MRQVNRRDLLLASLRMAVGLPSAALLAACSRDGPPQGDAAPEPAQAEATAEPTPIPPPFVIPAGEERRLLMADTPEETPLYIFASGSPGPVLMTLGGVHGNEPGGWLAAERIVGQVRPASGALLVAPRANVLAVQSFVRTTPELGDLNRLYPGDSSGPPMARMAAAIVATIREFHVSLLVDMHESWAFYKDRPQNGTAYLGQTVATYPADPGISLARAVVRNVNATLSAPWEELFYREFPPNRLPNPTSDRPADTSGSPAAAVSGGSASSLGLPRHVPNLAVLLVEMGQQQALERRVTLHVAVHAQVMREIGILG